MEKRYRLLWSESLPEEGRRENEVKFAGRVSQYSDKREIDLVTRSSFHAVYRLADSAIRLNLGEVANRDFNYPLLSIYASNNRKIGKIRDKLERATQMFLEELKEDK